MNSKLITGTIVKGIGGFYYVKTENGIIATRGRGNLKRDGNSLLVGDEVRLSLLESSEESFQGIIEDVFPRKNSLIRPPIANVDKLVLVVSATKPRVNYELLDRFLVVAEEKHIPVLILMNKADTGLEDEISRLMHRYGNFYDCLPVSVISKHNISRLSEMLADKKVAFAGPSGVGKSSIINLLSDDGEMETGEISWKNQRGRHTTRHVEILNGRHGSLIFDTPGFTSIDLPDIDNSELKEYFPEFLSFNGKCKFQNCNHIKEPGCRVMEAIEQGSINNERHESYIRLFNEIHENSKY
ncbi:MAG: ribosome small subunit-dependent GTPase A [Peptostreptococcaceae bacterium]|nr:ribosome small subunit-dependent GTPase A [Peptostreptococcaceae bacterium]MDY5738868.1 ribosome small subunit-dependent GTPase A [Anaerovoracaceae bacterium]